MTYYTIPLDHLRDEGIHHEVVEFGPSTVLAGKIPTRMEESFSILIWGVVLRSLRWLPGLAEQLIPSVNEAVPTLFYLAGWGLLSYQQVDGGEFVGSPWEPRLDLDRLNPASLSQWGDQKLQRAWPRRNPNSKLYEVCGTLEQPFSFIGLSLYTTGPVLLHFDPSHVVTVKQLQLNPQHYDHDLARERQLLHLHSEIGL